MYDRKIYLYFALVIVGFLLWTAWQKDYAPQPMPAATTPAQTNIAPATTGDLSNQTAPSAAEVPANRIIQVQTDTFQIQIDKQGGNIISVKLPKYPTSYETPNVPVTLLTTELDNFYQAKNGVTGKDGFNSDSLVFSSSQDNYQLDANQDALNVTLTAKANDKEVKKTYVFTKGKYDVNVSTSINNLAQTPYNANFYSEIKRRGLSDGSSAFGLKTYRGAAISSPQTPYEKISYQKMDKENLDRSIKDGWLAMQQRYFVSAWVPRTNDTLRYYSSVMSVGATDKPADKIYTIGNQTPDYTIPANGTVTTNATFYGGPEITDNLKQIAPHLDLVVDYGWLWIFSVPIFKVMQWINNFVNNWGVSIILVTVLIKLLFYKLSETSYRSMAKMKNLQPKILALKERYGDDRQKLSQATMELYRKEKVNPLGGCLPMIVQIPVFIALYYVLIESVELRQAPFIFWIHDLSVKDPYYVLPILMGLSWMLQQKLNPPPPDPVQAKMMMLFPVVFTVLFAAFPAGLVLYWLVNNCLSILQQWYIMRKVENEGKKKTVTKNRIGSTTK